MLFGPGCASHSPGTWQSKADERLAAACNLHRSGTRLASEHDNGESLMHRAAASHDPECLQTLLARGVNPDAVDPQTGRTPVMTAIMAERRLHFDLLMQAGADIALADHMDNTPLHVAAQVNEPELVLALLKAGAPTGALNRQGRSFQTYLLMTPDRLLNARTRKARQDVLHWLTSKGIAVERSSP
jgi:uncharacterized protein